MNDIYSSSTEATWENDNADLRHDRNNNSNGNTERGMGAKKMEKKDEEKGEGGGISIERERDNMVENITGSLPGGCLLYNLLSFTIRRYVLSRCAIFRIIFFS